MDTSPSVATGTTAQLKSFQLSHLAYLLAVVGGRVEVDSRDDTDDFYTETDSRAEHSLVNVINVASLAHVTKASIKLNKYQRRKAMHKQRTEMLGHRYGSVFNPDSRPEQDFTAPPESERALALGRVAATMALAYRTLYGHTRAHGTPDRLGHFSNRKLEKYDGMMPLELPQSTRVANKRQHLTSPSSGTPEISESNIQPSCAIAAGYLRVAAEDANSHWLRHAPQAEPGIMFFERPDLDYYRGTGGEEAQFNEQRAEQGDPHSIFWLGSNYYRGLAGYPQDRQLAREYYQRAADLGQVDAQYNLAVMEHDGDGFPPGQEVPEIGERMQRANHWWVEKE